MGDYETRAPVLVESSLGYHPYDAEVLTRSYETSFGTLSVGQFDWGGRLLKSNGGVQRFPQRDWKPRVECKGKRELDCEANEPSRDESRT